VTAPQPDPVEEHADTVDGGYADPGDFPPADDAPDPRTPDRQEPG
jgi:hypothetical protein